MKYKAVITDLDGVVVDSPGQKVPSHKLINAAQKLLYSGVQIFAATGRAISFARPIMTTLPTSPYAIVAGGTHIIDPKTEQSVWSCGVSSEQILQIVKILKSSNKHYGYIWNDYTEEDYLAGGWDLAKFDPNAEIYFFEISFVPEDQADDLIKKLNEIPGIAIIKLVSMKPHTNDIHIMSQSATKENAIAELSKLTGIPQNEMIGIGDGHNDLHLFNAVGKKVAMGNAVPELKEKADLIIGDIKDDGLADFFEKLADAKGEIE